MLSRGPDELIVVIDDQFEQALPQQTASALAAAAQKAGFDLILCGDGSSDLYAQQVGLLVGEILNIPAVNGVSKIISLTFRCLRLLLFPLISIPHKFLR